jgi:uncharacterized membrane protein
MNDMLENLLNFPHLHMLLNHFPTIGSVVGIGLLVLGYVRRNEHLKKASLEVIFVVALITLPAYLTGAAAGDRIKDLAGVSLPAIDAHEDAAIVAFAVMELAGLAAWVALWQYRRRPELPNGTVAVTLVLAVVSLALMGRAASIGGEIRHPEIVAAGLTSGAAAGGAAPGWLSAGQLRTAITEYRWIWPAAETAHFLGLCLALGILVAINLRLLGAMKGVSYAALHRLLPWGLLAFGVNLVTGMIFFIAAPEQYTSNPIFYWKAIFIVVSGFNFLYLTVFSGTWSLQPGDDARLPDKMMAAAAIGLWVGVIYWGRMLPFLGNAF